MAIKQIVVADKFSRKTFDGLLVDLLRRTLFNHLALR